ncbi:MAG: purine-nucleoside phosphorylase [Bacteroidota bacterium]
MIEKIKEAFEFIRNKSDFKPEFGIVLGTGLGGLVEELQISERLSYEEIPHFPLSTVEFHSGELLFGILGEKKVVVMHGRFHYYEGYNMEEVTFGIRVMKLLGIEKLFVSNAAGGLNPDYSLSDLMIIEDHINLLPENPLRGQNIHELGDRFPDMSEPYDLVLIDQAKKIVKEEDIPCQSGVYTAVQGPNLETKAEYKFLRIIGSDAVGMSTIPENIVARHMGLPCFAVSVITDMCIPETLEKADIQKIIGAAKKAEPGMTKLISRLINIQ